MKDHVLYSKLRPYLNKVVIPDEPGYGTTELIPLLPDKKLITREYLAYLLRSDAFVAKFSNAVAGTKMPRVSMDTFWKFPVPLPPIDLQMEFGDFVKQVDKSRHIFEQEVSYFDELVKSRFVELFGTLRNNEKGFKIVTLNEIFPGLTDGTHQTPTYTEDKENGFKFLSSKDVTSGKICWDNVKYIPPKLHEELQKRISPKRGDILLAKNGTTGICAKVDTDEIFDIYVSLALLRQTGEYNVDYLVAAINSPETKMQFDENLKGIGVPNLHLGEIRKTRILAPPRELQDRFATFMEQVDTLKSLLLEKLLKIHLS